MDRYDHKDVEKKWQEKWEEDQLYKTPSKGDPFYTLVEFAYPSGDLHVGHWYAFSVPDMYARYKRMQGKTVMFPFGFDAFGLPAENAAIKRKENPRTWTYGNIDYMRKQLRTMGASFDWSREVITCDPSYYKWTQWIFLQFLNKGIAYHGKALANWCPSCKTVLANEQAVGGECERCGNKVEQREMKQWMLKITDYADRLIDDLTALDWPESIKDAQRNWIGRSHGSTLSFKLKAKSQKLEASIDVFTTRPDTLYGATYMVLAPEHKLVEEFLEGQNSNVKIQNKGEVVRYIEQSGQKSELERQENKEKTGVELKGVKAINPANNEEIPIFIADYVLAHYGTGAIMAVPAHDERDYDFAKKFSLPIIEVISGGDISKEAYTGYGELVNSEKINGMSVEDAKDAITKQVSGKKETTYRLRDWLVSRQRYWGSPIPVIHCEKCGSVGVPEKDLPVELPEIEDYLPRDDGQSPLAKVTDWVNTKCPKCGGDAKRETDTLDTFIDSSWYFMRYTDPHNDKAFADPKKLKSWMPVDMYSGGAEHTTLHVLYSRFFQKALFDIGLVKDEEPFTVRRNRGTILGPDGQKMSKSRGNVVNPDDYVKDVGADAVRMYLAFIGPYNVVGAYPWDPKSISGVRRFIDRVWKLHKNLSDSSGDCLEVALHTMIRGVTKSFEDFKFNTAVSSLMTFLNIAEKEGISKKDFEILLRVLSPLAPHITEELWHDLGNSTSIHKETWPPYDESKLVSDTIKLAVSVNGKVRAEFEVASDTPEEDVKEQALSLENISKWVGDSKPSRVVYVPGRLVNIVISE